MENQERQNQEKVTTGHQSSSLDADKLKDKATQAAEQIKARGKDQLEAGKKTAAAGIEQLAGALDQATDSLERSEQQSLAGYAQEVAASARSFANNLRDRSVDDLIGETQTLARRNPTLFFFGSVAVGIALSRFLKASGERENSRFSDKIMPSGMTRSTSDWQRTQGSTGNLQAEYRPEISTGQTASPEFADDIEKKGV
jgi:uncharacterized phage infection (PIP) family protein YhgE